MKKPKGWKRTHDLTSEEIGAEKIVKEWTKGTTKIIITRYDTRPCGWGRFGYNLLTIRNYGKEDEREEWGDEVYSRWNAIGLAYDYMEGI